MIEQKFRYTSGRSIKYSYYEYNVLNYGLKLRRNDVSDSLLQPVFENGCSTLTETPL